MKTIIISSLAALIGYFIGKHIQSTLTEKAFNAGLVFAITKYEEGKLLLTPEYKVDANFVDCIFISYMKNTAPINLGDGPTYVSGCIFSTNIPINLERTTYSKNAENSFRILSKKLKSE